MALHAVLLAEKPRIEQEKIDSERILEAGKEVEKASVQLTRRIKEMNALYKERLINRRRSE